MNCDELQQLTAISALGALDGTDLVRWRERIEQDANARLEFSRFCQVVEALPGTVMPRLPSKAVRARVLDRIRSTPQQRAPADGAEKSDGKSEGREVRVEPGTRTGTGGGVTAGIQFIGHDAPWLPAPLPGARFKVLSASPVQAHVLLMIELAPGAVYPEHDHTGTEDMYVLTGDLQSEGRSLGPGDFLHAEPGSHHHELRSIDGCTALMVVPREAAGDLVAV